MLYPLSYEGLLLAGPAVAHRCGAAQAYRCDSSSGAARGGTCPDSTPPAGGRVLDVEQSPRAAFGDRPSRTRGIRGGVGQRRICPSIAPDGDRSEP